MNIDNVVIWTTSLTFLKIITLSSAAFLPQRLKIFTLVIYPRLVYLLRFLFVINFCYCAQFLCFRCSVGLMMLSVPLSIRLILYLHSLLEMLWYLTTASYPVKVLGKNVVVWMNFYIKALFFYIYILSLKWYYIPDGFWYYNIHILVPVIQIFF